MVANTRPGEPVQRGTRVLVVSLVHWASTSRLCLALAEGGFDVHVIAPAGHALHDCAWVNGQHLERTWAATARLVRKSIEELRPAIVVPGDDGAVELVRQIHAAALRQGATQLAALIEQSIGDQNAFAIASGKSRFVAMADSVGLRVPHTRLVPNAAAFERLLDKAKYPFVLKLDGSFGGRGVRIVGTIEEARAALRALRGEAGWRGALKRGVRRLDLHPLRGMFRKPAPISMQSYVEGRPGNRAVLCRNGKVLAGLSVEAIATMNATGPATVVQALDHPEMTAAAECMVERLGLSGFVGFDFVLEAETRRAHLLEMNLRPTQICHLARDAGSDMIGALASALGGTAARRLLPNFPGATVALFPQESWRDSHSPYLATAFHDVPLQAPEIVSAYRRPVAFEPPDWLSKLRMRQPPIANSIEPEAVDV